MALTDLVGPAVGDFTGAVALIRPIGRSIGQIFPDVVIDENHADESIVTSDPVQGGAIVTDHIFDRPPAVQIRGGFSNSSAGFEGYVQQQYQALLNLKASKTPFFLSTGKRAYQSMVIQGLQVVTDQRSEYILMFVATCVHINIVRGSTAGNDPSTAAPAANSSDQANPASTTGTSNVGSAAANPVSPQAFAGAYGPGSTLNPGTGIAPGAIGDSSLGAVGSGLAGLSAPPLSTAEVGELVATDPATGNVVGTAPASPGYNPFATGAFGGT